MTSVLERRTADPDSARRTGTAMVLGAMTVFGVNNVIIASIGFPGLVLSSYRLLLGSTAMVILLRLVRGRWVTLEMVKIGLFGGSMYGLSILLFFSALKLTSVANVSIIATLQAAVVLVFVNRMFGERVALSDVALTLVALAGTALVVVTGSSEGSSSVGGDLVAVAAMLAGTAYFVGSKRARTRLSAFEYQTVALVISAVLATPVALVSGQAMGGSAGDVGLLLVMAGTGTVGHFSLNWAHQHTELKLSSLMTLVVPIVSTILAWVVLEESLATGQIAGIGIVIASLAVAISRSTPSPSVVPVDPEPGV